MKRPDLDNVRELLRAKNYEAVAEIEPQIIEYCKQKLNNCINSIELMQTLLLTLESQYSEKEKDSTNPLPDYLFGVKESEVNFQVLILLLFWFQRGNLGH